MDEKWLCNFLTIILYVSASINTLRKNATFEQTPLFPLETVAISNKLIKFIWCVHNISPCAKVAQIWKLTKLII